MATDAVAKAASDLICAARSGPDDALREAYSNPKQAAEELADTIALLTEARDLLLGGGA